VCPPVRSLMGVMLCSAWKSSPSLDQTGEYRTLQEGT
jgi:hypothetical protein